METARPGRSVEVDVLALDGALRKTKHDDVVAEEPLEIRLGSGSAARTLAVTMRTPGNDFELVAGFLYGEAIARKRGDIVTMDYCIDPQIDAEQRYNIVSVELSSGADPVDPARFERHFVTSSACGVCGRAQIDSLKELGVVPLRDGLRLPVSLLYELPQRMRDGQRVFASTGGVHAAALFDETGKLLALREDVGRHNAVDKIAGWALLNSRIPLERCILAVSGRAGYEIVQKSVMARIPVVCSVSAPSSLAVELAREFGVTLVGFLRGATANVYTEPDRISA